MLLDIFTDEQLDKFSGMIFEEKMRRAKLKILQMPPLSEEERKLGKMRAARSYRERVGCSVVTAIVMVEDSQQD